MCLIRLVCSKNTKSHRLHNLYKISNDFLLLGRKIYDDIRTAPHRNLSLYIYFFTKSHDCPKVRALQILIISILLWVRCAVWCAYWCFCPDPRAGMHIQQKAIVFIICTKYEMIFYSWVGWNMIYAPHHTVTSLSLSLSIYIYIFFFFTKSQDCLNARYVGS